MSSGRAVFLTGATGLVGGGVLRGMLDRDPDLRVYALVRDAARWSLASARHGFSPDRVTPLSGDIREPGLGLDAGARRRVASEVDAVLHFAADTTFSLPLAEARAFNVEGTRNVVEVMTEWPRAQRLVFTSTAFVAGRRRGLIRNDDPAEEDSLAAGWVNHYERCKYDAERLVRGIDREWVIFRPSSIVCDGPSGVVSQFNVVHRTLRLYHHGLASMLPGGADSTVDAVPADYVTRAILGLAFRPETNRRILHVCAGAGALPLDELLDTTYSIWTRSGDWRRKGVCQPAVTDLETYRLFERSVEEAGEARLVQVMRSLSFFIPQLAFPKTFDTGPVDDALGEAAPPVRSYWPGLIGHLLETDWAAAVRARP